MHRIPSLPTWQKAIVVMTSVLMAVAIIGLLYWARVLLIPLALALVFTFLLAPLVVMVQRRVRHRVVSVIIVLTTTIMILFGLTWIVSSQVSALSADLPEYAANLQKRLALLEANLEDRGSARLANGVGMVREQLQPTDEGDDKLPAWVHHAGSYLGPVAEILGQVGLAVILAFFMLMKKEDLRNRIFRLAGHGRLMVTTKALDEAGRRISRFLLTQFLINVCFGVALAIGFLLLEIPYALLWAFLAAVLRYVPFIGAWIGAAPVILLSLVAFDGWWQPLAVLALFLVLEVGCVNLLEPWLLGHSLGISEVSQLMAVACWAFLWGPLGLVLSGPLTVCLLVFAKHVPELHFLTILLGDQPALDPATALYQRLAARDQDEASQIITEALGEMPVGELYDHVLVPALTYAKRDYERQGLSEEETEYIFKAMREVMEDVVPEPEVGDESETAAAPPLRIVACPARDAADTLALDMVGKLLDPRRWVINVMTEDNLASEMVGSVTDEKPAVVLLAALPPGGLAHARYLCKRLRKQCPQARILVGRWGQQDQASEEVDSLSAAGGDRVDFSLLGTVQHLRSWQPALEEQESTIRDDGVDVTERREELVST